MHPRLHADSTPEATALIMSASDACLTYRALEGRTNRAAHTLRALGLIRGDTVALACENRAEFLDIYWATQRSGLTLVPLSTRLKTSEVAYIITDSGAKLLLISAGMIETARELAAMQGDITGLEQIVAIDPIDDLPEWTALCAAQPDSPIADESIGGRMVYSSGTTGQPKGIRFPLATGTPVQPNPAAQLFGGLYKLGADTVYLSPAPLYHSAPMGFTTSVQSLGGTVVLMPKFEPELFLKAVEQWRVTAVMMVPTMFIRLLKLPPHVRARYDHSSLKTVVHAAAPCPVPVKRAMIDWLGPIIEEFYAGSEGNGHVVISSAEWLRKPGSVGRAIVGTIHICADDGNEVSVGEIGTIYFSGGKSFSYHNAPDKTAASHNPCHPEWSTMGDVGHIDDEGYLFLSDRKDFMIISGGVNIYPQEVENLLIGHPGVADVAVFGVPHPDFGEEVKAVVQPADWSQAGAAFATELMVWTRAQLADVKCPRSIDFLPALPRAETGKLYKKELKARYWPQD
ncbi:acyl-CoA synthetase [Sphingomonas psychrolutea]|uniref:Acyl-CoA synthetase n=1 Tax=Sphingomonas psychrolutea TaxID=1259676 RepID=A0ABQ1G5X2_9SPHN|nr:acyl-CoA synthetase [Sphingomonas psychrolutea]GGA37349.1 acyl-CoA synthetase [Sphingomonas psychrolutea]